MREETHREDEPDGPGPVAFYPWSLIGGAAVAVELAQGRPHPAWLVTGFVAFAALYVTSIRYSFRTGQGSRQAVVPLALLAAVTLATTLGFGHSTLVLFPLLSVACGAVVRWRRGPWAPYLVAIVGVVGALVAWADGSSTGGVLTLLWGTGMTGLVVAIILKLFNVIAELHETRDELARTAVSEERLRFARDLHDVLGHTLSVMVVKAQAVRKLATRDGALAAEQAADIEAVGRDALRQVRRTVSGYRERDLDTEIDGARTALRDAGIEAVVRRDGPPPPTTVAALLGWAVREGTTNVIRHSRARRCEITMTDREGASTLTVGDDGVGGHAPRGNGLTGLAERMAEAGGSLDTGPAADGGFLLAVTLPTEGTR